MKQKLISSDIIFFLVTLLLATLFGAYLSFEQVTDPFLYYDVGFIKSLAQESQMVIPEKGPYASLVYVPGREMLMVQLVNMMGIAPETLQFLPLGVIFVSMSLYLLSLRLFQSPPVASLVTLYLTLNLSHAAAIYSTFAYAFGLPLFFAFVVVSLRLFGQRSTREIVLCLLLFVGSHLIHYTVTSWMIVFLLGSNLVIWLLNSLNRKGSISLLPAYHFSMALVVIYLAFNEAIYKSFLPLIGLETVEGAVQRFLIYLSIEPALAHSPYLFQRATVVSVISTLSLLIILLPVALGLVHDSWQLIRRRLSGQHSPIIWGIFLMGIVDAVAYTIRGSISTKSFSMIFPLIALLYVQRTGKRSLFYGMATLLLLSSLIKVGIFHHHSYVIGRAENGASYAEVQPSAEWLQAHLSQPQIAMLADMNLYGKYLVASVGQQTQPILQGYTDDLFEQTLGTRAGLADQSHIVAIDTTSAEPTIGFVWALFEPLHRYLPEIRDNSNLHLVYDDGSIWFGIPKSKQ